MKRIVGNGEREEMGQVIARNCKLYYVNKVNTFLILAPVLHINAGTP